jgi:hypothetical protein
MITETVSCGFKFETPANNFGDHASRPADGLGTCRPANAPPHPALGLDVTNCQTYGDGLATPSMPPGLYVARYLLRMVNIGAMVMHATWTVRACPSLR